MVDINLNLYRIFFVLANSKTFIEASEKLCISQPAVSKHIKNLEQSLNIKLFHIDNTGLKLTTEGRELLEYIEKSYNILIAGQRKIMENQNLDHGSIIIGAPSHIASFYLMNFIRLFRNDYPGIFIRIISGSTSFLLEELKQHKIDFMIDSSPIEFDFSNLIVEKLISFDTCFITHKQSLSNIKHEDLEKHEYIMPVERSNIRKNIEIELRKNNIKLPVVLEVETTELIIDAVKNDIGIGYVIKEAVKNEIIKENLFVINSEHELPKIN